MHAGFDYGTSNCSIGIVRGGRVELLALENGESQIPSTLYAPRPPRQDRRAAIDVRGIDLAALPFESLRFGTAALRAYLREPLEGYFVKSPKSFLGARGLAPELRGRFVAVVGAMMENVKRTAEAACSASIDRVVVGRPVHFQGAAGVEEDARALAMLREAARAAGFREVAFQLEPMAAAMDYEVGLTREERVLVLDIGGGTTDCSFVRVGPHRRDSLDRDGDVLGHGGERIGGNDYDQFLALRALAPALGFGDVLKSGLPIPNTYFVDAVSVNDVNAQLRFSSAACRRELARYAREARDPVRVRRLLDVQRTRQTFRLVRSAEEAKIALSDAASVPVDLGYLELGLAVEVTREELRRSAERLLAHLAGLVGEVIAQAQTSPDVVYLTGGMASATIVRRFLREQLGDTKVVDGDHFASVTTGLTVWAERIWGQPAVRSRSRFGSESDPLNIPRSRP
jgi:hypothetical chaperone protein